MSQLLPLARIQYTDGNGSPLSGGTVAFTQPGTGGAVLRPIWADVGETIPLQNPCPLDSSGITFSGGSQVSVWGFGQYEEFVRDNSGNLIYSALVQTTAGGLIGGGTINGSLQITGNLSVNGNITDVQQINANDFIGNTGTLGTLTSYTTDLQGPTTIDNLTATGPAEFNGGLDASSITIGGQPIPRMTGGTFLTDTINTQFTTQLIPPFTGITSASATYGPGTQGTVMDGAPAIESVGQSSIVINAPGTDTETTTGEQFYIYWMVMGT